jgi:hypothetical protein
MLQGVEKLADAVQVRGGGEGAVPVRAEGARKRCATCSWLLARR